MGLTVMDWVFIVRGEVAVYLGIMGWMGRM